VVTPLTTSLVGVEVVLVGTAMGITGSGHRLGALQGAPETRVIVTGNEAPESVITLFACAREKKKNTKPMTAKQNIAIGKNKRTPSFLMIVLYFMALYRRK
jgi:hypothetical protein